MIEVGKTPLCESSRQPQSPYLGRRAGGPGRKKVDEAGLIPFVVGSSGLVSKGMGLLR